jgi:hypothetical protein
MKNLTLNKKYYPYQSHCQYLLAISAMHSLLTQYVHIVCISRFINIRNNL